MNLLDLAILAVFAFFVLSGVYRGFLPTLLAIAAYILSWLLALIFLPAGAKAITANQSLYNQMLYYTEGSEYVGDVEFAKTDISSIGAAELAEIYSAADVYVNPTYCDTFPTTNLEALACGTPVVTSNRSSLPEVVGDAAVLVDPYSAPSIAEGIQRVLSDASLRRTLSERGLARARQFSWEASVRRILEVYMDVASGRSPAS